jgi:hypothetical protein
MKNAKKQLNLTPAKEVYLAPAVWRETIQIENGFAASGTAAQLDEENEFGDIE